MRSFLIKRMLSVIPTVLFVLLFSFVLKTLSPGDEVRARLELNGETEHFSNFNYLTSYRDLSHDLGYDLPSFYFGIRPSYFPDTLQRIIPQSRRQLLTSCLRQTKDWKKVSKVNHLLTSVRKELAGSSDYNRLVHIEVIKMAQTKQLSDLKAYVRKIESLLGENPPTPTTSELLVSINDLEEAQLFSYPVLFWNGTKNQFHKWISRIFKSKENISLLDGTPSFSKISRALKWTLSLSIIVLALKILISLILGYAQARFKDGWFDMFTSALLYILLAIPTFWLASLMVVFFTTQEYGQWTNIFPSIGLKPSFVDRSFLAEFIANAEQVILPVTCLTVLSLSYTTLQLKSDLLDAMKQPYVLMAKAKGLSKSQVFKAHALPNALLPFVTIISGSLPRIFAGSVIIEVIFNIPGVGRLLLSSLNQNDWPVVFSIVIVISMATVFSYLLGDILLMVLYPKTSSDLGSSNIVGQ